LSPPFICVAVDERISKTLGHAALLASGYSWQSNTAGAARQPESETFAAWIENSTGRTLKSGDVGGTVTEPAEDAGSLCYTRRYASYALPSAVCAFPA